MKDRSTGKGQISVKTRGLLAATSALAISLGIAVEGADAGGKSGCGQTTAGAGQQNCGTTATAIKLDSQQHKLGTNQIKWNSQQHKTGSPLIEWNNVDSNQHKLESRQHKNESNQIKWESQQHK
jgi:hypothetical protein